MVIESLREEYPLLAEEAKNVFISQKGIDMYRPDRTDIMDISWGQTGDPEFWNTVYNLFDEDYLNLAKMMRPHLFEQKGEGTIVINNGLFG